MGADGRPAAVRYFPGQKAVPKVGADNLLAGETNGIAFDFTGNSGLGYVSVLDTTTPANVLHNARANTVLKQNSSSSPKIVLRDDGLYHWTDHNLALQSQAFDNASWTKSGTTATADQTTAPDGTVTADLLAETNTASASSHRASQNITTITGETYTCAVCFKDNTRRYGRLIANQNGSTTVWSGVRIDLNDGSVTSAAGSGGGTVVAASSTSLGSGWWLLQLTFIATSTTMVLRACCANSSAIASGNSAGEVSYTGSTSNSLYVWGARFNHGTTLSTYYSTTTAAFVDIPIEYDPVAGKWHLVAEIGITNLALQGSNFTATWTLSSMSAALTATDPMGNSTGASTLTATAGNATALQAITSASSNRRTYVWLKRRTGTGNIDLTQDNGTTWTTQSVTASWQRFAIPNVSAATNPTVGIRIVTSGDAVDVAWFVHAATSVSMGATGSPVPTFTTTASRVNDSMTFPVGVFPWSELAGTSYCEFVCSQINGTSASGPDFLSDGDGTSTGFFHDISMDLRGFPNAGQTSGLASIGTYNAASRIGVTFAWDASGQCASDNGTAVNTSATSGVAATSRTQICVGCRGRGSNDNQPNQGTIAKAVWAVRRVANADVPNWRWT